MGMEGFLHLTVEPVADPLLEAGGIMDDAQDFFLKRVCNEISISVLTSNSLDIMKG
jgi:hypothetical protein